MDCSVEQETVNCVCQISPSDSAEMVAVPQLTADTWPALLIVATPGLFDAHVTFAFGRTGLVTGGENTPRAFNVICPGLGIIGLIGYTVMDCRTAFPPGALQATVNVVCPITLASCPVTVVCPQLTAVASPLSLIVATLTLLEDHVTEFVSVSGPAFGWFVVPMAWN